MWKVILPQALIVALRPYGNEIILMIKGSAIVAIITVYDLMGETRLAFSRTFDFQTYIWAALIYLVAGRDAAPRHRMDRAPVDAAPHPLDFPHIAPAPLPGGPMQARLRTREAA